MKKTYREQFVDNLIKDRIFIDHLYYRKIGNNTSKFKKINVSFYGLYDGNIFVNSSGINSDVLDRLSEDVEIILNDHYKKLTNGTYEFMYYVNNNRKTIIVNILKVIERVKYIQSNRYKAPDRKLFKI